MRECRLVAGAHYKGDCSSGSASESIQEFDLQDRPQVVVAELVFDLALFSLDIGLQLRRIGQQTGTPQVADFGFTLPQHADFGADRESFRQRAAITDS